LDRVGDVDVAGVVGRDEIEAVCMARRVVAEPRELRRSFADPQLALRFVLGRSLHRVDVAVREVAVTDCRRGGRRARQHRHQLRRRRRSQFFRHSPPLLVVENVSVLAQIVRSSRRKPKRSFRNRPPIGPLQRGTVGGGLQRPIRLGLTLRQPVGIARAAAGAVVARWRERSAASIPARRIPTAVRRHSN